MELGNEEERILHGFPNSLLLFRLMARVMESPLRYRFFDPVTILEGARTSALHRELENRIPESGQTMAFERVDRAPDAASHRLKHHLNRHPVPEWMHQQVYLNPHPKPLVLRDDV